MMDKNYKVMAIILGTQNEERRVGEFNKCKIYQRQKKPRKTAKNLLNKFVQMTRRASTTKRKLGYKRVSIAESNKR